MHVQDTNTARQGNRPRVGPALAKVGLLAFAAACVPVASGWLIVALLAVGIDG